MNYKISIITPEHSKENIPFLLELYNSLLEQTYDNWEWVLYVNGECKISDIPKKIRDNLKVKIVKGISSYKIGYIKNKAFFLGKGDILVEVDHDDFLAPECLEELNSAFQDPDVGFVYSDCVLYDMRGEKSKIPWREDNGWKYEWVEYNDEKYIRHYSFPPSSRSLSFIWYSPDHVRAWRKSVYHDIGGHNCELSVCDDHELLIRSYLQTKFYHIPKPLYYYRYLPPGQKNTQTIRNEQIQKDTVQLSYKYAQQLAERDADLSGLMKIDLGGGLFPRAGYTTVDQQDADIVCDLNEGIPLPDNSVGVINASHIIEHLKDPIKTMSEIHRVLCDGGWAFIEVPSTDGRGAWQDPTHVSFWNENSFWYYTRKEKAQFIRNTTIRFQEFRLETNWWENNIAVVNVWLCAVKSDKLRPHPVRI